MPTDQNEGPRSQICPVCGGKGWNKIPYIKEEPRRACTCGRCLGTGQVRGCAVTDQNELRERGAVALFDLDLAADLRRDTWEQASEQVKDRYRLQSNAVLAAASPTAEAEGASDPAARTKPSKVGCPTCGAGPGEPCRSVYGASHRTGAPISEYHKARKQTARASLAASPSPTVDTEGEGVAMVKQVLADTCLCPICSARVPVDTETAFERGFREGRAARGILPVADSR